jgi:glutathionylspermidine synthase
MACREDSSYYETKGEGYVFDGIKDKPVKGAAVKVTTTQSRNIKVTPTDSAILYDACVRQVEEIFTTDESGYFQISFPKRLDEADMFSYQLEFRPTLTDSSYSNCFSILLTPEDLEENKKITFGRIIFYQNEP